MEPSKLALFEVANTQLEPSTLKLELDPPVTAVSRLCVSQIVSCRMASRNTVFA